MTEKLCSACGFAHAAHESHNYLYHDDVIPGGLRDPISLLPLVDPIILESCGHMFSRQSIARHLSVQKTCPLDSVPISMWRSPFAPPPSDIVAAVDELKVICLFCLHISLPFEFKCKRRLKKVKIFFLKKLSMKRFTSIYSHSRQCLQTSPFVCGKIILTSQVNCPNSCASCVDGIERRYLPAHLSLCMKNAVLVPTTTWELSRLIKHVCISCRESNTRGRVSDVEGALLCDLCSARYTISSKACVACKVSRGL
jgi:hypothetical protein